MTLTRRSGGGPRRNSMPAYAWAMEGCHRSIEASKPHGVGPVGSLANATAVSLASRQGKTEWPLSDWASPTIRHTV